MGQKSNPIGLRLQINRTWDSRWYAEGRDYAQLLKEDIAIRKYIVEALPQAAISKVVRVRVDSSKNRLNTLLPRNNGTFLTSRLETSRKLAAVSRMWVRT